jgi:hypothetical protein
MDSLQQSEDAFFSALANQADPPSPDERWQPQEKQQLARKLVGQCDELLYGGAAGGGKSFWLVQHTIDEMVAYPGNRGVIFRRVFPSLNRTIVPRVRAAIRGLGQYNETLHEVKFNNGSILELATLQRAESVENFQGPEYGVVAFEELTEFLESQYLHLIGRLRAPVDGVHPHAVSTTNPGGVGHRWVKRRFVKPAEVDLEENAGPPVPCDIWRPRATTENSTPDFPPLSRCFVPAKLEDNPALTKRDPGYMVRLRANNSRAKRKALEFGDWDAIDAIEGALWEQSWLDGSRVDEAPQSQLRVVAVDPSEGKGGGDGYGVCVASLGEDDRGYVEQSWSWTKPIAKLIDDTVALAKEVGADRVVVEKNHGGLWLVEAFKSRHPNFTITTVWASDAKRTRAEPVSVLFEPIDDEDPRAVLVGYHPELEEQMTTYIGHPPSPDELDACVWALTELMLQAGDATALIGAARRMAEKAKERAAASTSLDPPRVRVPA